LLAVMQQVRMVSLIVAVVVAVLLLSELMR
jgi:hypothetical protein